MNELRSGMAENRRQLARAPQLQPQPLQRLAATSSTPAAPGTLQALEEERQRLRNARDLRTAAREAVDRVFARAQEWAQATHGRPLDLNPLNQRDAGAEIALRAAERAAERFVAVSLSPQTSQATREAALGIFTEAVAGWLGKATEGWESAQQLAEREAREQAEAWRR